eukprot:TRINITY_DN8504_c0_g1_i2.p2 TRINITY_DN8504_c0_g1~~TRINITY_DN8504_c0_g1_i2.p2  ORF type:complete len:144 (-),score=27.84 TRINITY_DN8504_c0_g1_i2:223-654(-)
MTPVPGGVGPMTVAMLIKNTITSAKRLTDQIPARAPREHAGQNATYKQEYERALAEIARLQAAPREEVDVEPVEPAPYVAYERPPFYGYDPRQYTVAPGYGYATALPRCYRPAPTWMFQDESAGSRTAVAEGLAGARPGYGYY